MPRVASPTSPRPSPRRWHSPLHRTLAAVAIGATLLAGAACSSEPDASQAQDPQTTTSADTAGASTAGASTAAAPATSGTSTPPEGSGATAPGITHTTAPPIVPRGSTRANIACRQMFPVVNDAITSWNSANSRNHRTELSASAEALKKAADTIPGVAAESQDSQLVTLTRAVAAQLMQVVSDYSNDRDVSGTALERAATSLWSYCESTR